MLFYHVISCVGLLNNNNIVDFLHYRRQLYTSLYEAFYNQYRRKIRPNVCLCVLFWVFFPSVHASECV